jgi:hypothetical protein
MASSPAAALCIYHGADNAQTTLAQEFTDARWVVHARVIGATDGIIERGKPDAGMGYTVYTLAVLHDYKGHAPNRIRFFTERNSGGFYMDRAWVPLPKGHDIGGEYLLFLNPVAPYRGQPAAEVNATFVNYACGQSRQWARVSTRSRQLLTRLASKR